ncbi:MAG: HNH endonuclease domain-containing protein [Bacteroidia bacterium]|nr:HNH endonuclease domain-containing protein [Bacteroidia bacterium]
MKKIGIDLGSSSLGFVITEEGDIIKKGVIRFDTGMMKGQSGGYVSPTRERREARSKRNLIRARKYRKWELLKILVQGDFVPLTIEELEVWSKYKKGQIRKFPENKIFQKWLACDFSYLGGIKYKNPYELRIHALGTKVSKHEFGRALYHIIQRRGYKDIGETDSETEKQKERRGESGFQKALDENENIISKALVNEFLRNNKRARNQYPYREEYQFELEELCKAQGYDTSKKNDGRYKNVFIEKLWKSIIWQRDLRTQKGNIGKCTLEPKKLRCPISHPIFEIFRAWSFINTIMFFDDNGEKQSIPFSLKEKLFDFFLKKDKNFKFEEIRVFLDKQFQSKKRYNYPINTREKNKNEIYTDGVYDTSVSGMPVCKGLIDVFGDVAKKALETIEIQNITSKETNGGFGNASYVTNNYSINDLWHILFSYDKKATKVKDFLEVFAKEKLKMTDEKQIAKFVKLNDKFSQGYADLSVNAMCKIIPFLKEGYLYNDAVVLAKVPDVLGENWKSSKNTILSIVRDANVVYADNKTIISITNNLIDKYKGDPYFAHKDFLYQLSSYDILEVEKACLGFFGEISWEKRNDKQGIIDAVKQKYQEFFSNEKRTYRELPTFTEIFNEKLKSENIIIDANQLYHHSNIENIYLKKCGTDKNTGKPRLPKAKNINGDEVSILPSVQIDSIKNPMFNKSMSILRKLMNEFIKEGVINEETEIVLEIARELNDNNKRIAIERYQNERRNNREKYREFLTEYNNLNKLDLNIEENIPKFEMWTEQIFDEVIDENGIKIKNTNRLDILKEKNAIRRYELWMEQKGQCLYTGKMIPIGKLFSIEIDIEHTIPRSILPDDTLANQTVCYAWYNRDKKRNHFPTQCSNYYEDADGWGARIEPRLDNWKNIRDSWKYRYEKNSKPQGNEDETTKNKRIQEKHYCKMHYDYWLDKIERFEATEIKDSWARRQLVDTQMVSKYARAFLKTYFLKVAVQKGMVTSVFRKLFGFQDEDEIKSRNKHTHHAIDALVLTLIPTNSSHRERIIKEYFKAIEEKDKSKIKEIKKNEIPQSFNVQKFILEIENSTLIYNFEKKSISKQTSKIVRKRGKRQYLKDKNGKYILNESGERILLMSKGSTVRSSLYAQTYLGKIRNVERSADGKPIREGEDWKYKTGNDEFSFVKRENIDKVKASENLINSIIDPIIRELVRKQKGKAEIKDYQGNIIRHVRIQTKAGKEVKERVNYRSKHEYKNKFYSEAGSIPFAILVQQFDTDSVKREMIPIASYEIAKMRNIVGKFDVNKYVQDFYSDYKDWEKQLLKVGQKVFVLKEDDEYEKLKDISFQTNRLYVITQFSEGSIWLKYHLSAMSVNEVKDAVSLAKDELLSKYEQMYDIAPVVEDLTILDNNERRNDFLNRKYRFDTINNSFRLKQLSENIGIEKTKEIKKDLDKFKAIPSTIEIEGQTHLLKMSKENWNFIIEGKDFTMNIDGSINFKF